MAEFLSFDHKMQIVRGGVGRKTLGRYYDRPNISYGMVFCKKCGKPCDFESSAAHNAANPGRSRMYIHAVCHGEVADVLMTFQQWHDNPDHQRIEVFDDGSMIEDKPRAPMLFPQPMPLLLMDKKYLR